MNGSDRNSTKSRSANAQKSANADQMNAEQALAVAWEALVALAKMKKLTIAKTKKGQIWFSIANTTLAKTPEGRYDLVFKSANADPGVGTPQKSTHTGDEK